MDLRANGKDTGATTDELNLLDRKARVGKSLLERALETVEDTRDELLAFFATDTAPCVDVVDDRLDVRWRFRIRGENRPDLVAISSETT